MKTVFEGFFIDGIDLAGGNITVNTLYSANLPYSDDNTGLHATLITGVEASLSLAISGAVATTNASWGRIRFNIGKPDITSTSEFDGESNVFYHKAWVVNRGSGSDSNGGAIMLSDDGILVDDRVRNIYRGPTLNYNIRLESSVAATLKFKVAYSRVLLTQSEALELFL